MTALGLLFWGCLGLLVYVYVGFPLLLLARSRMRPRPHRSARETPAVSVVIAARNEEGVIGSRVENLLQVDYPKSRLEVVIASDGSADGTNEIVRRYADGRVRLLELD